MKILVLDRDGELLALALRLRDAGHSIVWFSVQEFGSGVPGFTYADNWASHIGAVDLTVSSRRSDKLSFFKSRGHAVVAPAPVSTFIERTHFDTPHAAVCFVKSTPAAYSVRWGERDVYHSPHAADMIEYLGAMTHMGEVSLQERVSGVRVHVSRFGTGSQLESVAGAGTVVDQNKSPFTLPIVNDSSLTSGVFVVPEAGPPQLVDLTSGVVSSLWLSSIVGDPLPWLMNAPGVQIRSDVGVCLKLRRSQPLGCLPVWGVTRGTALHLCPRMSKWGSASNLGVKSRTKDAGGWLAVGGDVADIIGRGHSVAQAARRAKSTADKLYSAHTDYDTRGVEASAGALNFLHARGMCLGLRYGT